MSTDAQIKSQLDALVRSVDAPPVPLANIHERMAQLRFPEKPREHRFAVAAAVAAAAVISIVPLVSPAVMQGIEARYRAAVQALGGIAPPPPPAGLVAKLHSHSGTLAQAQSRVAFTIVPPAGLPRGAVLTNVMTDTTGILDARSGSWSVGPPVVTFWYRRADGREFTIVAERYDAQAKPLGKYVFEARNPAPNGKPVLIKHQRFAWRNGDQLMDIVSGAALSTPEILAIQSAMHGVSVPLRKLHAPDKSPFHTLRLIQIR